MDLMWWIVAVVACLGLAVCVGVALLWPGRAPHRPLRALANTHRLTTLPEYVRAVRRQAVAAAVAITMLSVAFTAAALATARPTGFPAPQRQTAADQPEDVIVCVGGPATDPAIQATLTYFADQVRDFGSERIGLSSANRRLIPLTRDYQYAAAVFAQSRRAELTAPVAYSDYAPGVADILAMCLTGFPDFDEQTAQRRSLIYVGPGSGPPDPRPALFDADAVGELVRTAGVQVNAVTDGAGLAGDLARATGGTAYPETADVTARLQQIRANPPAPVRDPESATAVSAETPDLAVLLALLAVATVLAWPVVMRR